jgi:predicted RNase H-like nuclease (RuvC/YqgF family)
VAAEATATAATATRAAILNSENSARSKNAQGVTEALRSIIPLLAILIPLTYQAINIQRLMRDNQEDNKKLERRIDELEQQKAALNNNLDSTSVNDKASHHHSRKITKASARCAPASSSN